MVLEPIPEEPEDDSVDFFNRSDGEIPPSTRRGRRVLRSLSAPSRVYSGDDTAVAQKEEQNIKEGGERENHEIFSTDNVGP